MHARREHFMHACIFACLHRYAGVFLSPRSRMRTFICAVRVHILGCLSSCTRMHTCIRAVSTRTCTHAPQRGRISAHTLPKPRIMRASTRRGDNACMHTCRHRYVGVLLSLQSRMRTLICACACTWACTRKHACRHARRHLCAYVNEHTQLKACARGDTHAGADDIVSASKPQQANTITVANDTHRTITHKQT
jgi:hypothetical protein